MTATLALSLSSLFAEALPPGGVPPLVPSATLRGVILEVTSGPKVTSFLIKDRSRALWVDVQKNTRLTFADRRPARLSEFTVGKRIGVVPRGKVESGKRHTQAKLIVLEAASPPS